MVQFLAVTHDDEEILSVFPNREDSWERHSDAFKKFGIDGAREVIERVKQRISGKVNGSRYIFKCEPESSDKLEVESVKTLQFGSAVEVTVAKSHGE